MDVNLKLNVTGRSENSITLHWDSVEYATGFNVVAAAPIKDGPYPYSVQTFNVTNEKKVVQIASKY